MDKNISSCKKKNHFLLFLSIEKIELHIPKAYDVNQLMMTQCLKMSSFYLLFSPSRRFFTTYFTRLLALMHKSSVIISRKHL
jgi:hypothetical protein